MEIFSVKEKYKSNKCYKYSTLCTMLSNKKQKNEGHFLVPTAESTSFGIKQKYNLLIYNRPCVTAARF